MVENLVLHQYKTLEGIETKIPTEVLISDRREFELAECGFIGLTMYKNTDKACFFSANSVQKPKTFPDTAEGQADQTNYKLGTRLTYMMMISRLAHYLKVIQRDNIQTWQSPTKMQTELTDWMRQYAADMDNPTEEVANRRPIRKFNIDVAEVPGEVGFYKVDLQVMPHIKFEGANFTLSLGRQARQAIAVGQSPRRVDAGFGYRAVRGRCGGYEARCVSAHLDRWRGCLGTR